MSKSFELEGKLLKIMDTQTFRNDFTKREFVIEEPDDRYPQPVKMSVVKNNCALLDSMKEGDTVRVTFSLRGNLYNDRYYTDLQAFKIVKVDTDDGSTSEPIPQPAESDTFETDPVKDDDLPF